MVYAQEDTQLVQVKRLNLVEIYIFLNVFLDV